MESWKNELYESGYLAHHGIEGQKWGVKHGPPYPLPQSNKKLSKKHFGPNTPVVKDDGDLKAISDKEIINVVRKFRTKEDPTDFGDITTKVFGREYTLPVSYNTYDNIDNNTKEETLKKIKQIDYKDAANELRKYIKREYSDDLNQMEDKSLDNVFRFIKPGQFYIPGSLFKNIGDVGLMCNFRFDPEHGLVIVFDNGKISAIGPQDIIL